RVDRDRRGLRGSAQRRIAYDQRARGTGDLATAATHLDLHRVGAWNREGVRDAGSARRPGCHSGAVAEVPAVVERAPAGHTGHHAEVHRLPGRYGARRHVGEAGNLGNAAATDAVAGREAEAVGGDRIAGDIADAAADQADLV